MLPESIEDERQMDEGSEERAEFVKAAVGAAEGFEATEEPFDRVAPLVECALILPGLDSVGRGGKTGVKPRSAANWRVASPLVGAVQAWARAAELGDAIKTRNIELHARELIWSALLVLTLATDGAPNGR